MTANADPQIMPEILAGNVSAPPDVYVFYAALLLVAVGIIFVLTRREKWAGFAQRRKWSSRLILLVLSIFIAAPMLALTGLVFKYMPGKITMESPNFSATAIKLGLYSLYVEHEAENAVSPDKRDLVKCVNVISDQEAAIYQRQCGDNQTCYENIPSLSRAALIELIKKYQASKTPPDGCKSIDIKKL